MKKIYDKEGIGYIVLPFYESIDGQNEGTDYVIVSSYSLQEFMDSAIELQKVMLELYKAEKGKQE